MSGRYTHPRPVGVTVLVVLLWIQALAGILGGIFLIIDNNDADLLDYIGESSDTVMAIGIGALVIGLITALVASALGNASNFARWIVGFIALLHLAGSIYSFVALDGVTRGSAVVDGLISLIVLYVLFAERGSEDFFTR